MRYAFQMHGHVSNVSIFSRSITCYLLTEPCLARWGRIPIIVLNLPLLPEGQLALAESKSQPHPLSSPARNPISVRTERCIMTDSHSEPLYQKKAEPSVMDHIITCFTALQEPSSCCNIVGDAAAI